MNKKQRVTDNKTSLITKRGDIWLVEFPKVEESRKTVRPCLVVSNDIQNELDRWIMVAPLTTENIESVKKWEVCLEKTSKLEIDYPSKILFNYLRTVKLIPNEGEVSAKKTTEKEKIGEK